MTNTSEPNTAAPNDGYDGYDGYDQVSKESPVGSPSRRRFLLAAAGGVGAVAASAGYPGTAHGKNHYTYGINGGATALSGGHRSSGVQVGTTLPPPPTAPPRSWRDGQFVTHVSVKNKMMALTFDDGPSPWNTRRVLSILDRFGINATFFLIGVNVRAWPALAKQAHEAGHELGNHSMFHTPYRAESLAAQIGPNQNVIRDATGYTPIVNRTPALTKGQVILDTCAKHGLYECHTDMQTFDWRRPRHSAARLFREFVKYQHNGAFALYHDGAERRPTVEALPDIIRHGQNLGYRFVTASELMSAGIPQPVTTSNHYAARPSGGGAFGAHTRSIRLNHVDDQDGHVDTCNYDAKATLKQMLDGDLSIRYADRMRIVEALADLEAVEKLDGIEPTRFRVR